MPSTRPKAGESLADLLPQLAKEWHPTRNEDLKPSDVRIGSHKKVWWLCSEGHEWQAIIKNRSVGHGCPICKGLSTSKRNSTPKSNQSLNDLWPDIAKEWHPTKNGSLTPSDVGPSSNKKIWWQCSKGHEWQAPPNSRSRGRGCPYCTNRKIIQGENDLATVNPQLASEWHPTKNGDLKPSDVVPGSNKKVWWKCSQGHEWQATINARSSGTGCPICKNIIVAKKLSKPKKGESLADLRLDIAKEWHPTKNGSLTPSDVSPNSKKKIWWQCSKGHEWQAPPNSRSRGSGCPVCSNRKIIQGENDLATVNPQLASEWHPTKNGALMPFNVSPRSNKKVWWKCSKGHKWQATVSDRSQGRGCPYCSNKKIIRGENDLATVNPQLAKEWHPTKNGDLTPSDVTFGSGKRVWWLCSKGHEWNTTPSERNRGSGCPYCSSLSTSYPEQFIYWSLKQIFPETINRFKTATNVEYDIFIPSIKLAIEYSGAYWHKGKKHKDLYKKQLAKEHDVTFFEVVEDRRTLSCDGIVVNNKSDQDLIVIINHILSAFDQASSIDYQYSHDMAMEYSTGKIEYEKSLEHSSPQLAAEWHPTKNGALKPADVTPGSNLLVWWKCSMGHEWIAEILNRSNGSGCPYCSGKKILRGENDLATVNPQLASEWHPTKNGDLKPSDVVPGSNKNVWWQCPKGHEWQAIINNRNRGSSCPYCTNNKVLPGENDLATINSQLASEWNTTKNGTLKPSAFTAKSSKKVWWKCSKGHEWQATIYNRSKGIGCPYCSNKKVCAGENDLATVNPQLASEWHPTKNGNLTPSDVTAGSSKKVWWRCSKGHEWQATINHRNRGNGCSKCSSLK